MIRKIMYKMFPIFGRQSDDQVRQGALVRGLFAFKIDGKWVYRDPIEIERKMRELCPDLDTDLKMIQASEHLKNADSPLAKDTKNKAEQAVFRIVQASREAFKIPPLTDDGQGMGENEVINIFAEFGDFTEELKKQYYPLPQSPARPAGNQSEETGPHLSLVTYLDTVSPRTGTGG